MMKRLNGKSKKTWAGIAAMILLIAFVLPMLPANVFANWVIRDTTTGQSATDTSDKVSVQYKFFAENLYVPPTDEAVYYVYGTAGEDGKYGTDDDGENNVIYNTANYEEPLTEEEIYSQYVSNAVTDSKITPTLTAQTSAQYCTVSHYTGSCNDNGYPANLTLTWSDIAITLSGGESITLQKYDSTSVDSYKVYTESGTSSISVGTTTVTNGSYYYSLGENVTIVVVATYTCTRTYSVTRGSANWCNKVSKKAYAYTATPTQSTTLSYKVYVKETVTSAEVKSGAYVISSDDYVIDNLASGSVITVPMYTDLVTALPADVQAWTKYIEGYYKDDLVYSKDSTNEDYLKVTSGGNTVFDFSTPLTSDTTIWVKLSTTYPNDSAYDDLRKTDINGLIDVEGSEVSVVGNVLDGHSHITDDIAYNASKNSFGLYKNITGMVNFNTNTGIYDLNAESTDTPEFSGSALSESRNEPNIYGGSKSKLTRQTPSLEGATPDYTVVLQNDVTVSGTLRLGGITGSTKENDYLPQGYIGGAFVSLDLNGHTLYVSGTFHSFGYIYDSVGTGKIVVQPTGNFYTPILIYGWHGIGHSLKSYGMGSSPFEDYNLPYIQTTIELETNGSQSATFTGFSMVFVDEKIGISNIYMPLFGSSDAMFTTAPIKSDGTGKVVLTTMKIDTLTPKLSTYCLDSKNVFTFHDLSVTFNPPTITVKALTQQAPLDLRRTCFPISSMIDLTMCSSNLTIKQPIIVMPGATITVDDASTLTLSSQTVKELTGVSMYFETVSNKNLAGEIYVANYNIHQSTVQKSFNGAKYGLAVGNNFADFWTYFDRAAINIYGTLVLDESPTTQYALSGNINISKFKTSSMIDAVDWNQVNVNKYLSEMNLRTYGSIGVIAQCVTGATGGDQSGRFRHYYTSTLISNGVSYLFDNSSNTSALTGVYDVNTGVFTATNGDTYIILSGATMPKDGNSKGLTTYANSAVKATVTSEIATVGSTQYVYYAGVYNPVSGTAVDTAAITAGTTTCTIDGKLFITGGSNRTLQWNGTMWQDITA